MSVRILVVDDEPDVEMLFRQQFRRDVRAGALHDGLRAVRPRPRWRSSTGTSGEQIILLLSDINMPGMSGLELLPKVKARRPDLPVFMITAYGDAETIADGARPRGEQVSDQASGLPRAEARCRAGDHGGARGRLKAGFAPYG